MNKIDDATIEKVMAFFNYEDEENEERKATVDELKESKKSYNMTPQEFCKAYTEIYGEPLDNLEQLSRQTFTGQELFEFVNDILKIFNPAKVMCESDLLKIEKELKKLSRRDNCVIVFPSDAEFKPFPELKEVDEMPIELKEKRKSKGHERPYRYHR